MSLKGRHKSLALVLVLTGLIWTGAATPAWCEPISALSVMKPTLLLDNDYINPVDITETYVAPMVERSDEIDDVLFILEALLAYENYERFKVYNPELRGNIPIEHIARVLFVVSALNPNSRIRWDPKIPKYAVFDSRGGSFYFMFATHQKEVVGNLVRIRTPGQVFLNDRQQKDYGSVWGWLSQETGLFSGAHWTMENTLPRILTIGGVVFAILLLTEVIRFLLGIGTSYLRSRRRG